MSEAENLLDTLTDEEISAYTVDPSTEPHIVIGADRKITVPDVLKRLAVQFDHNVETVTFDCPRYWDGVDMKDMAVYINYLTPIGEPKSYIAKSVRESTDESMMHFDWTIDGSVTQEKGNIKFLVCIQKVEQVPVEGSTIGETVPRVTFHWNSEICTDCYISEGFEVDGDSMDSEQYSLITDLLVKASAAEAEAVKAQTSSNEAKTFAEEAKAAAEAAEETASSITDFAVPNLVNGDGEYSVAQRYDSENAKTKAVSRASVAMGVNTVAGCKAYKILEVYGEDGLYLRLSGIEGLNDGDTCSILKNGCTLSDSYQIQGIFSGDSVTFNVPITVDVITSWDEVNGVITSKVISSGTTLTSYNSESSTDTYYLIDHDSPMAGDTDIGLGARAFGTDNKALGEDSEVTGTENVATSPRAKATGLRTQALAYGAEAHGRHTVAAGHYSVAQNEANVTMAKFSTVMGSHNTVGADAEASLTAGFQNTNNASYATATGWKNNVDKSARGASVTGRENIVKGENHIVAGRSNNVNTHNTSVSGQGNMVTGQYSEVSGQNNNVPGLAAHASGSGNLAEGAQSSVEGSGNKATAEAAHAEGKDTEASGVTSHAENEGTIASGDHSHAGGSGSEAKADMAFAHGNHVSASGVASVAIGTSFFDESGTIERALEASGPASLATGAGTQASGFASVTFGADTIASGDHSHAGGSGSEAKADMAFAHGNHVSAGGIASVAFGTSMINEDGSVNEWTGAGGNAAFAAGMGARANGNASAAFGYGTVTETDCQMVVGSYNETDSDAMFIVGNGSDDDNRSTTFKVMKDGRVIVPGKLIVDSIDVDYENTYVVRYEGNMYDDTNDIISDASGSSFAKNRIRNLLYDIAYNNYKVSDWDCTSYPVIVEQFEVSGSDELAFYMPKTSVYITPVSGSYADGNLKLNIHLTTIHEHFDASDSTEPLTQYYTSISATLDQSRTLGSGSMSIGTRVAKLSAYTNKKSDISL